VGTNVDAIPDNAILTVGPLQVTGTAGFALTMLTVDADTDGNGTADLMGATLTGLALDVTGAGVSIEDVAALTVSGRLGIATLAPAQVLDTRSWFGLKMGEVTVSGGLDPSLGIQLSATITIGALDYNSATNPTNPTAAKRLDWARAFDLDGDGQFDDVLNPGAGLPVAAELAIDFASSLQLRLTGTLTGTGVVGTNVDAIPDNAILTVGPLQVTGTAGFALTMLTVDADTDGNGTADLMGDRGCGGAAGVGAAGDRDARACRCARYAQLVRAEDGRGDGVRGTGSVAGDPALGDDHDRGAGLQQCDEPDDADGGQAAGLGARVRSGWGRGV